MIVTLLLVWQWLIAPGRAYNGWEPRIALPGECGKREYYNECGSSCRLDCHSSQISTDCKSQTCEQGCYCKGGFYRNGKGGPCVKKEMCKRFHTVDKNKTQVQQLEEALNDLLNKCDSHAKKPKGVCDKGRSEIIGDNKKRLLELLWKVIRMLHGPGSLKKPPHIRRRYKFR